MSKIIKTVSCSQDEILQNIISLYCPDGIELDPTYSKGNFYKSIPQPKFKYDLVPQTSSVIKADCCSLPHKKDSIKSIMFDPPFVAAIPKQKATGIITTRFGYYRNIQHDLWGMYKNAIKEFSRILVPSGVLIFKCQDTIDSGKQYFSHVQIIIEAIRNNFYPKDLFILVAKSRLMSPNMRVQKHARKFHSYFLVFIKSISLVDYGV